MSQLSWQEGLVVLLGSTKPSPSGSQVSAFAAEILVRRAKDPSLAAQLSDEIAALSNALVSANGLAKAQACVVLGRIGPPAKAAIPNLDRSTKDSDATVRREASLALVRIRAEK